jgi:hypothetical protein
MNFVAKLEGVVGLERPLNCIGPTIQGLTLWADDVLKRQPQGAQVSIYEVVELHRVTISAPARAISSSTK